MKAKVPHSILVVDDNEQALTLVHDALSSRGYNVTTKSRGAEALVFLDTKDGAAIELVIIDLVMPDIDGMELASKILKKRPEVRILVMSGYADDVVVHGVLETERVDFLAKPFSIRDLFDRVGRLFKD